MVTLFLAGLHRRFLPHSTRARRWHLRKQFFLSWPECHICPDFLYLLFLFAFASPSPLPSRLVSCSTFRSARSFPFSLSPLSFSFLSFLSPFFFSSPPLSTFYLVSSLFASFSSFCIIIIITYPVRDTLSFTTDFIDALSSLVSTRLVRTRINIAFDDEEESEILNKRACIRVPGGESI